MTNQINFKVLVEFGNEEGYYDLRTVFKSSNFEEADAVAREKALKADNDGYYFEKVYLLDVKSDEYFEYLVDNQGNVYTQKVEN